MSAPAPSPAHVLADLLGHAAPDKIAARLAPGDADTARLRELAELLAAADDLTVEVHRAIADGDLAAVHATYHGFGPDPIVAFDIVRVEDGRIVAHWDATATRTPPNPSGRSQVDGPVEVTDHAYTAANRALVTGFVEQVLIGADYAQLPRFIAGDRYAQHNPAIADGLSGLGAAIEAMAAQGITMVYTTLHRVVAEGNFVLTQSEGLFGGAPMAYFDLFRVEDGLIVEHWDVMQPLPPTGAFRRRPAEH